MQSFTHEKSRGSLDCVIVSIHSSTRKLHSVSAIMYHNRYVSRKRLRMLLTITHVQGIKLKYSFLAADSPPRMFN